MRPRVLIVWEHGGNLGHLARILPIGQRLVEMGCECIFAVPDSKVAQHYLNSCGSPWIAIPPRAPGVESEDPVLNHADIWLRSGFADPRAAARQLMWWRTILQRVKPDVVLVDASPMALFAAAVWGFRAVPLGHGFEIPPPMAESLCFAPWVEQAQTKSDALNEKLKAAFVEVVQLLRTQQSVAIAPGNLSDFFQPNAVALCTWPECDHFNRANAGAATATTYAGPIWSELPAAAPFNWPDKAGAKVLCYLNVRDKKYDLIWQALGTHKANVVVVSPAGNPKACEAARGWGIHVIEQTVQLGSAMTEVAAVVNTGGMGLTCMALQSGKPLLIAPENQEQFILAYRLSKQGLAEATTRLKAKATVGAKVSNILAVRDGPDTTQRLSTRYEGYSPHTAIQAVAALVCKLANHQPPPI